MCVRCFKSYDFPSTFVGNCQEVAAGSDTDDSVDQSQTRNTLVFPFKLKPSPLAGATGPDWGPADYPASFGSGVMCQVVLRKWRDFDLAHLFSAWKAQF